MGALADNDGGYAAYRMSKTAINAVTAILVRRAARRDSGQLGVPRLGQDRHGRPHATRDVADGADTAVWLALDAPDKLTGKFVRDRKVIPW